MPRRSTRSRPGTTRLRTGFIPSSPILSMQQAASAPWSRLARFGTIEAIINNAGIGMSSIRPDAEARAPDIEELTPEIWEGFMAIFVRAPLILVRAALPDMKKRGFGRVINNTTSYVTMLRVLPYGAAKAALE